MKAFITRSLGLFPHVPLFLMLCFFILVSPALHAQNVSINNTGAAANVSAILDVSSTTNGMLIPRMTLVQITAMNPLSAAAQGLLVYQTDGVQGFYYNTSLTTIPNWIYVLGSNSAWGLTGNSGTDTSINFLGTTDAHGLLFKVNNQKAGYIDYGVTYNTSFGYQTSTTGSYNSLFGYQVLSANTTGHINTAMGYWALTANTTGSDNTAIGYTTLFRNTIGYSNTAYGEGTLSSNVAGNNGVAIGYNSQANVNNSALSWDNTNTSLGTNSLMGSGTKFK